MHKSFVVNVSDMLNNPGGRDEVEFEGLKTPKIEGLTDEGIRGTIILQSMNEKTVLVQLEHVVAKINDKSDLTGKEYVRKATCENYEAEFVLEFSDPEDEKRDVYDEEFPIDKKSLTIDLEDMLVQAINLQTPVIKYAKGEEASLKDEPDMDEFEAGQDSELHGDVTFRKAK